MNVTLLACVVPNRFDSSAILFILEDGGLEKDRQFPSLFSPVSPGRTTATDEFLSFAG
jgi:hypothetical protein